jgi:hypothetical protein
MGTHLILALVMVTQSPSLPTKQVAVSVTPPTQVATTQAPPQPVARCDARPWQRLVGRTVSDLLTIKLPEGTRVYRLDDPPSQTITPGRLSVELNRSTRVRRVYCS